MKQREQNKLWLLLGLLMATALLVNSLQQKAGAPSSWLETLGYKKSESTPSAAVAPTPVAQPSIVPAHPDSLSSNAAPAPTRALPASEQAQSSESSATAIHNLDTDEATTQYGMFEVTDTEINGIAVPAGMNATMVFCDDYPIATFEYYIDGRHVCDGSNEVGSADVNIRTPGTKHTEGWKLKPRQVVVKRKVAYVIYKGTQPGRSVWYPLAYAAGISERSPESSAPSSAVISTEGHPRMQQVALELGVYQANAHTLNCIVVPQGMSARMQILENTPVAFEYYVDGRLVREWSATGERKGEIIDIPTKHTEGLRLKPEQSVKTVDVAYIICRGAVPSDSVWIPQAQAAAKRPQDTAVFPARIVLGCLKVGVKNTPDDSMGITSMPLIPGADLRVYPTESIAWTWWDGEKVQTPSGQQRKFRIVHHFPKDPSSASLPPETHNDPKATFAGYSVDPGQGKDFVWFAFCSVPRGCTLTLTDAEWYRLALTTIDTRTPIQLNN